MYYRSQFQRFQSVVSAAPLFVGSQSIMPEKVERREEGNRRTRDREEGTVDPYSPRQHAPQGPTPFS